MHDTDAAELRELYAMADKRNQARWAWQRWLLMLAAGAFSVLVSLHAGRPYSGQALLALKIGLSANLLALLFGAAALYAEVQIASSLVQQRRDAIENRAMWRNTAASYAARPSWPLQAAVWLCYLSLCTSAFAWLSFVWLWPLASAAAPAVISVPK